MTYKTTHFNGTPVTYKLVNDGTQAIAEFVYEGVRARILPMFPGYAFTQDGWVLSFRKKTPIFLSPGNTGSGCYCNVNIGSGPMAKSQSVHIQICKAFHVNPSPTERTQVNHIDGNPRNNAASNLEWVTPRENWLHADALRKAEGRKLIVLTKGQKRAITTLYAAGTNMHVISTLLGLPYESIRGFIKRSKRRVAKVA